MTLESVAAFLEDLAALVNVDCGSHNKAGVDRVGDWIRARCIEWGWSVERLPQVDYGDCQVARLRGEGAGRLMLLGHLDTVYPDGTAAERPLRVEGDRILGPGVCDMKSGLLVGLYAVRALQATGFHDFSELVFFFNSDEELGSPASRAGYVPLARQADAVLVLESARRNGDIVSARKGCGDFLVRVRGRSAHAGVEPERGANAILELAHQTIALHGLNGVAPGVTVSAGVVGGGTQSNVVPEEAWLKVDVRAVDQAGVDAITRAVADLARHVSVPGTRVDIGGGFSFPPMAKTPAIARMAEFAKQAARELGFEVNDVSTGGASDANTVAGLGIPVLDGLGPIGGYDHSPQEYIEAGSLAPRTAMLAGLIRRVLERREEILALR